MSLFASTARSAWTRHVDGVSIEFDANIVLHRKGQAFLDPVLE